MEIVVSQKERERGRHTLTTGAITIGSDPSSEIHLSAPTILGKHARLFLVDGICLIQRLAPESAVVVNGGEVEKTRLYDQDIVQIGPFELIVHAAELPREAAQPQTATDIDAGNGADFQADAQAHRSPGGSERNGASSRGAGEGKKAAVASGRPKDTLTSTGVDVLSGPAEGKRINFECKSAKLGIKDQAVITIRPSQKGYMIAAASHYILATHNGNRLTHKPERLSDGDLIEFEGLKARFFVEPDA